MVLLLQELLATTSVSTDCPRSAAEFDLLFFNTNTAICHHAMIGAAVGQVGCTECLMFNQLPGFSQRGLREGDDQL